MDARYKLQRDYFLQFVRVPCAKVVGETSSEGFLFAKSVKKAGPI